MQSIMALLRRLFSGPPRRLEPFRPSELGPAPEACRYRVYTRDFDQEVNALELLSDEACLHFQERINDHFQRSKIASFIDESLLRRKIAAAGCENVAVQILVDNFNSTNVETFAKIASSCLRLVEVLDEIGVETEVLGYTTVEWRGGKSRELWINEGRPPLPGRLNDLRHIVYESFDEDSKDLLRSISRMGVVGVPKENIDGEALLWAAGRLFFA
ncbi:cobaltochelatase CobT-related protein [Salinarimonas sp.]|uniref:cobaltochelatase CobT-related protein n=1 Tax=Salinarimonas sp. TaxID=2766526 RepID=UPI00391D1C6C